MIDTGKVVIGSRYVPGADKNAYQVWLREQDPHTGTAWVRALFAKRYDDPAYLYLANRKIRKERYEKIKLTVIVVIAVVCILYKGVK